jgi:glc operon protein GlcG
MSAVISARSIGLEAGSDAAVAAVEEAKALGIAVCAAVVDRAGDLIAYLRMDGAPLVSARFAQDKAWTAAAFRCATDALWDDIGDVPALAHGLPKFERVAAFGGGVPIVDDGDIVGAVGISGGTPEQDRAVAEAAVRALALAPGVRP